MTLEAALNRIETFVGTRYDEKIVKALIEVCRVGQVRTAGAHPKAQMQTLPAKVA